MSPPLLLIPARLAAQRLPGKPLADIHGSPMILRVWRRAVASGLGPVAVATPDPEIARVIAAAGGVAVMTDPDCPTGTDRIHAALGTLDPDGRHAGVINIQGDLPTLDPAIITATWEALRDGPADIATPVAGLRHAGEATDPNVVKAAVEWGPGGRVGRALYFSRAAIPSDGTDLLHHIGLYCFRRAALDRFVAAPPGSLERRERLEQLRALAMGMRIDAVRVDSVPFGVDTPADLEAARAALAGVPA